MESQAKVEAKSVDHDIEEQAQGVSRMSRLPSVDANELNGLMDFASTGGLGTAYG